MQTTKNDTKNESYVQTKPKTKFNTKLFENSNIIIAPQNILYNTVTCLVIIISILNKYTKFKCIVDIFGFYCFWSFSRAVVMQQEEISVSFKF